MRARESHAVCFSVLITLLVVAPAFAWEAEVPYTSFAHVYEMSSPWNTDSGVVGGATWTQSDVGGTGVWTDTSPTGYLHQANTTDNMYTRQQQTAGVVGDSTAWTVEITARVNSNGTEDGSATSAPAGLYIGIKNAIAGPSNDEMLEVVMQTNKIQMRNSSGTWVEIDANSNTSDTTLRIVRDGDKVRMFRNGSTSLLGGQEYTVNPNTPGSTEDLDFIKFGDQAYFTSSGVDFDVDYLAFDTAHSYVPEPATLVVLAGGLAVCLLAKRR